MTLPVAPPRLDPSTRRTLPDAAGFWLVTATTTALLAASSAPSPLYPVYQTEFGFSALTLTAIFAVYVLALLCSLLTVGRLSDVIGRRPVLAVGLILEAASMAVFFSATGVVWLGIARIVQGLATGAAIGVLGAYLLDLQPAGRSRLGSLVNSAAPAGGLALGALVTGLLVQYGPDPTRLVFAILTGLFIVLALAGMALPETVRRTPGALAALRPRIAVPSTARRAFVRAVPTMVVTWAIGGLILSIGGSLLIAVFGQTNDAVIGAILAVFALAATGSAIIARNLTPPAMTRIGTPVLVAGTALFVVAVAASSLTAFIVASIVTGVGYGVGFLGALRSVLQLAEPRERAALLSAIYVVSYLAFSVPALAAGLLIMRYGLRDTALGYGSFVAVVAIAKLVLDLLPAGESAERQIGKPSSSSAGPDTIEPVTG